MTIEHAAPPLAGTAPSAPAEFRKDARRVHCIFGLPFDVVDRKTVLARVRNAVATRTPLFLTTPNTNNLVASGRDRAFRNSFVRSDLAIADGMPIIWIARMLGIPLSERLAGASLFEDLERGAAGPLKVYIFGGPDGAAKVAHDNINGRGGPMRCVGYCSPGFGTIDQMSTPTVIDEINQFNPDIVIAALGSQKGQAWVERNRRALGAPVITHLGAVVNFAAGTLVRAPLWIQEAGFEWLWRIKEEPALWRRYFKDGLTLLSLLATHMLPLLRIERFATRRDEAVVLSEQRGTVTRLALSGDWTRDVLDRRSAPGGAVAARGHDLELDVARIGTLDSAMVGWLMVLYGRQSNAGLGFRIVSPTAATRRCLASHCADFLVEEPLQRTSPEETARAPVAA
jgi:N-acetylglucosaminyldiphosphoundecaprenol N-acetyl-beta-D-mannosaminyltransferase